MTLSGTEAEAKESKVPDWTKTIFKHYINGDIEESELIGALEFLVEQGILKIGNDKYEKFSKEKFPDTEGFNPEWLKGESQKIKQSCAEQKEMNYQSAYCKFVD